MKINSTNGYLNLEDLPYNCIFNKVVTGCGGTTIALFNNECYVIAVPTTELITNKTGLPVAGEATITNYEGKQQKVFGLFDTFSYQTKKALKEYLANNTIKKIICTYDKVDSLNGFLNPANYRLLVDEYHILLKSYSYRDKAVNGVLNNFKKYKSFCFMSATPISMEYTPAVLEDAKLVEAEWNETDTLFVKLDQTNKPYVKAAKYINAYKKDGFITINGNKSYEAFFFINSVTDIAAILQYCELSNDEVKIVCADTPSNRRKLEGYSISNSRSENKKFTFITSKSFEGADYFSETALCFVVSNSSNKNTLLDISTDIYQIAGRIRTEDNPFRNLLVHIFNTAGRRELNLDITYEEMVAKVDKNIKGANKILDFINNDEDAKSMAEKMINSTYVMKDEDGDYFLNDMLVKLDLYNFKIEQMMYKTGIALRKEYNAKGVLTTGIDYERIEENLNAAIKKTTFKEAFLEYAAIKEHKFSIEDVSELVRIQPLIVEAYNVLGTDKVKKLKYVKTAIKEAIINADQSKSVEIKVAQMIINKIPVGFISSKDAKQIIQSIYSTCKITDKAKASDLVKWYDCKEVQKRIDNKKVRGYEIYSQKYLFN